MANASDLIDKYYAAFNGRDWATYERVFSADAETSASGGAAVHGIKDVTEWDKSWADAFPDSRITSVRKVAAGETIVSENRFAGTHKGTLRTPKGEVAPTGKRIDVPYVAVFQLKAGKLKMQRIYYDRLELQSQLGLA